MYTCVLLYDNCEKRQMVLLVYMVELTLQLYIIYLLYNYLIFKSNLSHTCGLACMLMSTIPLEKGKYNLGNGGHQHSVLYISSVFMYTHCSCLIFVMTTMTNYKFISLKNF